mmetsp:Transcript_781/g.1314  ORF Transcript_781/g.1314 Transcript_781/m.1314 type:complete len:347 (-) Transcript_781:306-1346(-)|eukprot:CAMPEP_0201977806 /NCGR_PEP_ID=MMETSP0904-20121228/61852_1 /ASSEMBLY_ACC=CAM_ASM_000553 /TAXON_ID=420261 /ORGANISM="Thalassiosira antarctica, Strain CCMP982" /LENGTH=346 /DNA_ID=CAMNT_0048529305 /DNA_START=162 /DNA_END=1202 /DNA_ORIENTATION=+
MTPRQKTSTSWASIAILAAMLALDGSHAFSSSSLPSSKTFTTPTSTINKLPISISSTTNNRKRHASSTSLQALPSSILTKAAAAACFTPPIANIALQLSALTATITGGVFAGSLHAIAGPDHLAALIPRCCGLPWYRAARVGAVWGLGHGVSATILGIAGFMFKKGVRFSGVFGLGNGNSFDVLHHAGSFMELAIGASLIIIGLLGIKEAREWEAPDESACEVAEGESSTPQSLSSAATPASMAINPNPAKRAVLFNGILHGFSWDGAPSLAPAVAISTLRGSLAFLISYALGTMAAMTLATTLIGEGTRRAAGKLDRPDLPRDLSLGSSFLALVVGVVWCGLALR